MIIDPRLHVQKELIHDIQQAVAAVFITRAYDHSLAADNVDGEVRIRAETGEKVTELLTKGDYERNDDIDWPGDPAQPTGTNVLWRETVNDELVADPGCKLWAGEVSVRPGHGMSGPFYIHKEAARAWAFSTALRLTEEEVVEVLIIPYACADRHAPKFLRDSDAGFRRLRHFLFRRYVLSAKEKPLFCRGERAADRRRSELLFAYARGSAGESSIGIELRQGNFESNAFQYQLAPFSELLGLLRPRAVL